MSHSDPQPRESSKVGKNIGLVLLPEAYFFLLAGFFLAFDLAGFLA